MDDPEINDQDLQDNLQANMPSVYCPRGPELLQVGIGRRRGSNIIGGHVMAARDGDGNEVGYSEESDYPMEVPGGMMTMYHYIHEVD